MWRNEFPVLLQKHTVVELETHDELFVCVSSKPELTGRRLLRRGHMQLRQRVFACDWRLHLVQVLLYLEIICIQCWKRDHWSLIITWLRRYYEWKERTPPEVNIFSNNTIVTNCWMRSERITMFWNLPSGSLNIEFCHYRIGVTESSESLNTEPSEVRSENW